MTTMVSTVARVLHDQFGGYYTEDDCRVAARLVIQAMREPTAGMTTVARRVEHEHYFPGMKWTEHAWRALPTMLVVKLWNGMIDEALRDG